MSILLFWAKWLQNYEMQLPKNISNITDLAQIALVLESNNVIISDSNFPSHSEYAILFSGSSHRNHSNQSLHDWFLEPWLSKNRPSLTKWQQELRYLKQVQPELFCQMVSVRSGGCQVTICKTKCRFPPIPFPGKEPATQYQ